MHEQCKFNKRSESRAADLIPRSDIRWVLKEKTELSKKKLFISAENVRFCAFACVMKSVEHKETAVLPSGRGGRDGWLAPHMVPVLPESNEAKWKCIKSSSDHEIRWKGGGS